MSAHLKLLVHFVVHMLVAAVLFGLVTLIAFGLWLFTEWLKSVGAPYEIWIVSYGVSELVFWLDVLCFVTYVSAEVWMLIRAIVSRVRTPGEPNA